MIVVGVDVHKRSLTAVAVDDAGRLLDEKTVVAANGELLAWASELAQERLWALEDCRQLTRWLERELLAAGEQLVRVPPKLRHRSVVQDGPAVSRTRSTRWPVRVLLCASRA
jgi:transposase